WSQGILINEFSALYNACHAGEEDPLPPLAIQYADYAAWQRRWVSGEVLQAQSAYWQRTLTGAPVLLQLPTDHPRPAQQDYAGAFVAFELDTALTQDLKDLSARHGTTLFMTLLAGWAALLSRLSGQDDLVIGTPMANRTQAEVEPLIGLFLNTLALRIDLSGSPSTADLLQRVKAHALEAQQHQDLPFEQVVEIVNPPRSLAHSPLFQVTFTWNNNEAGELKMPGLVLEPIGSPQVTAQFTMSLLLGEQDGVIGGGLAYATTLFERDTVERMLDYLRRILDAMVKQEYTPIEHLALLGNAERERLLVEWNATQAEYPARACIHELIEARAATSPDAVALEHGGTEVSYAELNSRANRLARHLRKQGVGPDTRVAICMTRGIDMVVGLLAVWKAGGAYVPLDPAYPPERLSFMLKDSAPVAVLMHAWIGEQTQYTLLAAAGFAPILDIDADAMRWNEEMQDNLPRTETGVEPDHLAYVIYTSGSTGQPKGVMVAHRGVGNLAQAQIAGFEIEADSRVLQFASFSFDACVSEIVTTLVQGATLVLPASDMVLAGPVLVEMLAQERITHVTLPPVVLAGLPEEAQLETVRTLVMAGEASNAALVRRFGRNRRLLNAYGPTEYTVCATMQVCDLQSEQAPAIGRPIANTRIYLLDVHGQPVPQGVVGEIHIGGVQVARGYLNRDELTAERFVADPFSSEPDARMYRTGDLGRYLADGSIQFLGRNDQQVKLRGFRIELGEIEAKLLEQQGVREAVVIAREDRPGDKRLVAYLTTDVQLDTEALRVSLQAVLPEYMVPAAYVQLDTLPLTPNGKLDRQALPAPEGDAYAVRAYEAPVGEVENALAAIWAEVLDLQLGTIGRADHFFALGGHSLLAMRVVSRVRESLNADLGVTELFDYPILAELASIIAQAAKPELPAIALASRESSLPLSFAQQRLWFLSQMEGVSQAYHIPLGLRMQGTLDRAALRHALDRIVAR
ncbi:amino acid adenylation domain-containing protein, partial [Herbaspirillum sp. GCM10030257]|uniref:non-ribosomal peptide synthetase n=1 Tax=Herbaspirillum sp. GCM10030257 TaxID=3273393 RepID=UPI003610BF08